MLVRTLSILSISLLVAGHSAMAAVPTELINMYNQAAQGDEDKTEEVYKALSSLIEKEGASALGLVYLGGSETLLGRDAFLPWNKMKYVEKGVAKIDKGLSLIDADFASPDLVMGLPENYLARANAAAVYTGLPDMFNQFDKGYDIYLELLSREDFPSYHPAAISWVYEYAIKAAENTGDSEQANKWSEQLQTLSSAD
ncbi:hypothetical protein [Vibrio hannami]|uniref:hypothetical protein n=2 Tax=Vibrio hannami TaxID=2717094 RepID=UPI003EB9AD6D